MQTLQRDLVFVGLFGLVAFGFHRLMEMERRYIEQQMTRSCSNSRPKSPPITDIRHPYWRTRLAQHWNYEAN